MHIQMPRPKSAIIAFWPSSMSVKVELRLVHCQVQSHKTFAEAHRNPGRPSLVSLNVMSTGRENKPDLRPLRLLYSSSRSRIIFI